MTKVVALGSGRQQRLHRQWHEGAFLGDGNVLYLRKGLGAQVYVFVKAQQMYA